MRFKLVIILAAALFLFSCSLFPVSAPAQTDTRIRRGPKVPANCDPLGNTGPALWLKTASDPDACGNLPGLCICRYKWDPVLARWDSSKNRGWTMVGRDFPIGLAFDLPDDHYLRIHNTTDP